MIDQLPNRIAAGSEFRAVSEQFAEPKTTNELPRDRTGRFVFGLIEMLPRTQDFVCIVKCIIGRILLCHEAQVVDHMREIFPCNPLEHFEDLLLLSGVFDRDSHTVAIVEYNVEIEGVFMHHPVIVCEWQDGKLGMKFPHVGTRLGDR